MAVIRLPHSGWRPRPYQKRLWSYLENGGTRAVEIAHRRWGKDEVALHHAMCSIMQRPATVWHCLPEFAQARKAIWNAIDPHTGRRRIDQAFPHELRDNTNDQEMFIRFKNGGTWQVIGSDRFNNLVGAGTAGVVFSEWALANPSAWGYIRPMVEENSGWAAFITTPRGNNHAKSMLDMAMENDRWFAEVSTVHDTGALTVEQLDESLKEYQALYGVDFGLAMFEQEYLCSFSGAMVGAYWGAEINRAEREGRICEFDIDPNHPVHTAWDLGKASNNPIWCFQVINGEPRIVDFYQPETDDLADWCQWLDDRGYHGTDFVPHDIIVTEWGSRRTRLDLLRDRKRNPRRLPMVAVADGLQAGRATINRARFRDTDRVRTGLEGLKNYRRDWDDERKTFRETPVKDWAEHIGSSFRYLGLAWKDYVPPVKEQPKPKELEFTARPDGSVSPNMDLKAQIDAMIARRRRK